MSNLIGGAVPEGLRCEAKLDIGSGCLRPATAIYGPECEAESGKLMYLCKDHAVLIRMWMDAHPNDPVECPEHGSIGPVKSYLILRKL